MKNRTITTSLMICMLLLGCSKDKQSTPTNFHIKFTETATPNNWEFVNKTSENTIDVNFTTDLAPVPEYNKSTPIDSYNVQVSTTSDFAVLKSEKVVLVYSPTLNGVLFEYKSPTKVTKTLFPYNNTIYFRVVRKEDNSSSETRSIKVNWN